MDNPKQTYEKFLLILSYGLLIQGNMKSPTLILDEAQWG